ncbi:flavodoxin domain-containing protein [Bifidobacterium sp. UBA6881]|uniref:flavodoxin domain-containing protein n=1 Tax=Bifidobacterium sp. UBA6881 TaxID=1946109 RepID=UPI000ED6D046|nr:flavodoxin domain-containing protein [Bifidobacterium sp. UBA6881]HAH52854.1 flavodoxin [Bifidobacterium sp.]HAK72291.1 flavodoxin [Bifidobacterium sp.]HCA74250.1 flavodoxin [Bifidobacterium sp.]HCH22528.1 flavodoxin [Bifidobacterium sp.]
MTVKVIYTSATGNTKTAVDVFTEALEDLGVDVDVVDAEDGVEVDEFFEDGDAFAIASWSDGANGEVPGGIVDFYDDLEDFDLSDKKVAVFGTGDTSYKSYCAAVDVFTDRVKQDGATILGEPLKIELSPDDDAEEALKSLAKTVAEAI